MTAPRMDFHFDELEIGQEFHGPGYTFTESGMDDLKWLKPVRAGDTIRARAKVIDLVPSKSKPDRGVLKLRVAAVNAAGEEVMTVTMNIIMKRRGA
jgi:acyl dehydratase